MRFTAADLDAMRERGVTTVNDVRAPAVSLPTLRARPARREEAHQIAYIEWCSYTRLRTGEPLVNYVIAIPNGGLRTAFEAARFKAAGVQSGYPDLEIVLPSGKYHGLHIEMKEGRNVATTKQLEWHQRLRACGRQVVVCWTWNDAARETTLYLGADPRWGPITEYRL